MLRFNSYLNAVDIFVVSKWHWATPIQTVSYKALSTGGRNPTGNKSRARRVKATTVAPANGKRLSLLRERHTTGTVFL